VTAPWVAAENRDSRRRADMRSIIWMIALAISLPAIVQAEQSRRERDCALILELLGIPGKGRSVLGAIANLQPDVREKAAEFRDNPTKTVVSQENLRRVVDAVNGGIEPLLIETLIYSHANLRRPPASSYQRDVLGPLGSVHVVPALYHQMLTEARGSMKADEASAIKMSRACLALAACDRGVDAVAFCNSMAASDDFASLTGLDREAVASVRRIAKSWEPGDSYWDLYRELLDSYDLMIDTPERQPLPEQQVARFCESFKRIWQMDECRTDMRHQDLFNLADVVALAKIQRDQRSLQVLEGLAGQLQESATKDELRWIRQALEYAGPRPLKRYFGKQPPLDELKPKSP
jgi:hypothetical protein